jgi:hypothetical protein
MAGSCCNVPDGKMLAYTLALKAATGMKPPVGPANLCAKKKQAGTECQWLHLHPGKHTHMDIDVATGTRPCRMCIDERTSAAKAAVRKAMDAIASAKLKARG